ncbi:MAG: hypothetical protein AAFO29_26625, partial [Actinomycetota bacterium]
MGADEGGFVPVSMMPVGDPTVVAVDVGVLVGLRDVCVVVIVIETEPTARQHRMTGEDDQQREAGEASS